MTVTCPACQFSDSDFAIVHDNVRDPSPGYAPNARRCPACRTVFLWPQMDENGIEDFYADNTQLKRALGTRFDWDDYKRRTLPDTERRLRLLQDFIDRDTTLLEVGCGYGFLLSRVRDQVREAIGIEPGRDRRAFATSELKLDVRVPPLPAAGIPSDSVDVACCFQVLEHIQQPGPFLAEIFVALKPGCPLIVEVPNFADLYVSLSRPYRHFHFQSAHAIYFTPATLRQVLEKAGFIVDTIKGVQRYAIGNAVHWLLHGKPQLRAPSRGHSDGNSTGLDRAYRALIQRYRRSDTIVCIAQKPATATGAMQR